MPVLTPAIALDKFISFGDLLKYLRRRIGLTQRELSIAVGYSDTQISRLELNQRLPDLATIAALFVPALGLEHEPATVERLMELAAAVRREDAPAPGLAPFKGLQYFDEADAHLFFGRETLAAKLVARLTGVGGEGRFLSVVGASGSGKSSIVRAGLIPALRWNRASADWPIHVITPTAHPLESLAASLTRDAHSPATTATLMDDFARDPRSLHLHARRSLESSGHTSRLLLIADQMEELFTLCRNEAERKAFVDNLLTAVEMDGPMVLVITVRADFYAHCAPYDNLREALAKHQEYIGPMTAEELRRAVEEPAKRGGWDFEPGLVDLLLKDVGEEPGALPLLSHALLETWQRRQGHTLTLSGYASSGGVRGAIAETAETVFTDQFTPEQQAIARSIFLRLTELGESEAVTETRRRATFDELILKPEDAPAVRDVLTKLADARLITTEEDTAEVAHEALIREWPTLRAWLDENREGLRLHRHLTEAAQEWDALGRDPGELVRGARLAQAREWAAGSKQAEAMNTLEREFLQASKDFAEREEAERQAQSQRELEAARKLAETEKRRAEDQTRAARQIRRRAWLLAGVLLVTIILAAFAVYQRQNALQQSGILLGAQAESEAKDGFYDRAVLLALEALERYPYTPQAEHALGQAVSNNRALQQYAGHTSAVTSLDWSPDGSKIASSSTDNTVCVWDPATGETLQVIELPKGITGNVFDWALTVKWTPDGQHLITLSGDRFFSGSQDYDLVLWDATTGEQVREIEIPNLAEPEQGEGNVTSTTHYPTGAAADFAPESGQLATIGGDNTAIVWDAALQAQALILTGHENDVNGIDWSPNETRLATASEDGTARIWDAKTGEEVTVLRGHTGAVNVVVWSPDGSQLATAGDDGLVRIWDAETGETIHTIESTGGIVWSLAWSPDGKSLAIGPDDKRIRVWDITANEPIVELNGHNDFITHIAWSPGDGRFASGGNDGIARVWEVTPDTVVMLPYRFLPDLDWSSDSRFLALPLGDPFELTEPGGLAIWDATTRRLVELDFDSYSFEADYSPDDRLLLVRQFSSWPDGFLNGDPAYVVNAATGEIVMEINASDGQWIRDGDWSPDGARFATASINGTIDIWDFQTGNLLRSMQHGAFVNQIEWSPDGTKLVSAGGPIARIWDAERGVELLALVGHEPPTEVNAAWSPDGARILTTSGNPDLGAPDTTVRIWDASTGETLLVIDRHTGPVTAGEWSPDGARIATISNDDTMRVWDATSGAELLSLSAPSVYATHLRWSPDGRYIAVGLDGAPARVFRVWQSTEELIAYAKECCVFRELTPKEREQFGLPPAPAAGSAPPGAQVGGVMTLVFALLTALPGTALIVWQNRGRAR